MNFAFDTLLEYVGFALLFAWAILSIYSHVRRRIELFRGAGFILIASVTVLVFPLQIGNRVNYSRILITKFEALDFLARANRGVAFTEARKAMTSVIELKLEFLEYRVANFNNPEVDENTIIMELAAARREIVDAQNGLEILLTSISSSNDEFKRIQDSLTSAELKFSDTSDEISLLEESIQVLFVFFTLLGGLQGSFGHLVFRHSASKGSQNADE